MDLRLTHALAGSPIGQSPSPAMHNAAFAELGLDFHYGLRPTPPDDLSALLGELHQRRWQGLNVTTPLKELVAPHVRLVGDAARARATNTLVLEEVGYAGYFTDVAGVREPLQERGIQGGEALVLGTGGAARAAVLALESLGCLVHVAGRRPQAAGQLLSDVEPKRPGQARDLSEAALQELWPRLSVVVQATALGKQGEALSLPWNLSGEALVAFEMNYLPQTTPFLSEAKLAGARVVEGWEMLLAQGTQAFELWTQAVAPKAVMKKALVQALGLGREILGEHP